MTRADHACSTICAAGCGGVTITAESRVSVPPCRPSRRAREIMRIFGLDESSPARVAQRTIIPPTRLTLPVPGPGVVLITGPSGSGKSTLLGVVREALDSRGVATLSPRAFDDAAPGDDARVIDLIAPDAPLASALRCLSLAGLADAFALLRRPGELSDGQRFRLGLARLLADAERACEAEGDDAPSPRVIIIDEFAATLDRVTARALAAGVRRWCDRTRATCVLATSHDDLGDALAPDVAIGTNLDGRVEIIVRDHAARIAGARCGSADIIIEPGAVADYRRLAAFHYRSLRTAPVSRVWRARSPDVSASQEACIGVLVLTMPALACAARDWAVGDRYAGLSQRERGLAINREVRCISRVIVDPRWRGLGIASRLVRHALRHPQPGVEFIEALAAMGRVHPLFERAGMRRFELPAHARPAPARMLDAVAAAGLDADDLRIDSPRFGELDHATRRWLLREAKRLLHAARRSRCEELDALDDASVLDAARRALAPAPVYYLWHVARGGGEEPA